MEKKLNLQIAHVYTVECYDKNGKLKWTEEFENLVTTEGLNTYLDYTLKTGNAAPVWYVGLKGTGAPAAGDVMNSHAGWSEIVAYTEANRQAYTPGTIAAGSVDNAAAKAAFSINGTTTVHGAFLTSNNTKNGTTGLLLGVGDFAASRALIDGDTLNVTVTASMTSA